MRSVGNYRRGIRREPDNRQKSHLKEYTYIHSSASQRCRSNTKDSRVCPSNPPICSRYDLYHNSFSEYFLVICATPRLDFALICLTPYVGIIIGPGRVAWTTRNPVRHTQRCGVQISPGAVRWEFNVILLLHMYNTYISTLHLIIITSY